MRRIVTIFVVLLCFSVESLQSGAISWETFTDSRQINSLAEFGGEIWAATSGGVMRFTDRGDALRKFTNSDGLGGNEITCVAVAGNCIWFGSKTGEISRYDPSEDRWRVFLVLDRDGNGIAINDMAVHGEFLWLATEIGVCKFDMLRHGGEIKETYRRLGGFTVETSVLSVSVWRDTILAVSVEGIALADVNDEFLRDYSHWKTATEDVSLGFPESHIASAAAFGDKYMVGTSSGLYVVSETDSMFVWEQAGLSGTDVIRIRREDDSLIVTSGDAVYLYSATSLTPYDLTGMPEASLLSSLLLDGGMVVGTAQSGVFLESVGWRNITVQGPTSNQIRDLGVDSRGTVWSITNRPYISSFDGNEWRHHETGFPEVTNQSLVVDEHDGIWVGTSGGGALRLAGDSLIRYDTTNSSLFGVEENYRFVVVPDMDVDQSGRVWFTCYRGHPMRPVSFYDVDDDVWDHYTDREGLFDHFILSIHAMGNTVWTGYDNAGLVRTDFGSDPFYHEDIMSRQFTIDDFLPSNNIRVMVSSVGLQGADFRDTTLWIGTNAGLARYEYGYDLIFRTDLPDGIGPQINALEIDSRNNLWIGTASGLAVLLADGSGFDVFTTANSMIAGNEVTALLYDEDGYVWIGTSSGLSRLDYGFGDVTDVVEDVVGHPNPFIIPTHDRVFFNYDGDADVWIFSLAGELVRKTSNAEGWDGRNDGGQLVASGMYLFHMRTLDGESYTGKIAIIRR